MSRISRLSIVTIGRRERVNSASMPAKGAVGTGEETRSSCCRGKVGFRYGIFHAENNVCKVGSCVFFRRQPPL
jgi:hypothetical protein